MVCYVSKVFKINIYLKWNEQNSFISSLGLIVRDSTKICLESGRKGPNCAKYIIDNTMVLQLGMYNNMNG